MATKNTRPLKVGSAPYTPPSPGQLVIKNGAVAINPFDWVIQMAGGLFLPYLKGPFIGGTDIAGTVLEVGPGVDRFRVGDRVNGAAAAIDPASKNPAEGGFQLYTVLRQHLVTPTPGRSNNRSHSRRAGLCLDPRLGDGGLRSLSFGLSCARHAYGAYTFLCRRNWRNSCCDHFGQLV
jgi:NADPH:quinone reductase-like Zn-dependent oxidoreductase